MCVLIFILCHFEFLGVQKVGIHITLLLTFKVHRGDGNVGVGGGSHPRVKAVKLESPTSVGSHLVSWRLRNVRPGKGWHSKLKGAGSGQPAACVDAVWSEGREGRREGGRGVCACGPAHVCLLRQLLQTAVEKLSLIFVLPNNDKAWCESPGAQRQRRLQERSWGAEGCHPLISVARCSLLQFCGDPGLPRRQGCQTLLRGY